MKIIKAMTPEQIKEYINSHLLYNTDFEVMFFKENSIEIFKQYNGQYVRIEYVDQKTKQVQSRIFLIRESFIQELQTFIQQGWALEENQPGSDVELQYNVCNVTGVEILPQKLNNKETVRSTTYTKRQGAYLNYLNLCQHLDLQILQIGNTLEQHKEISNEQCFLYALKQSNVYTEQEILIIQSQMNESNELFSIASIKKLQGLGHIIITEYCDNEKTHMMHINKNNTQYEVVRIGYYKNHYFYNCDMLISKLWINKYNEYKTNPKFINTMNLNQIRGNSFRANKDDNFISAGTVLQTLMSNNLLQEITEVNAHNLKDQLKKIVSAPIDCNGLQNIKKQEQEEEKEEQEEEQDKRIIIYADFESFTKNHKGESIKHEPFLLCFTNGLNTDEILHGRNIYSLLNHIDQITEKEKKNLYVYFHNLSYDAAFILKEQLQINTVLRSDGNLIQFDVYRKNCKVTFRDSTRIFGPTKLSELPKMFLSIEQQKQIFKEVFPYNYYTMDTYCDQYGDVAEASKHIGKHTKGQFIQSLQAANCISEDFKKFDMEKYALYYCKQDVRVLSKSMERFQEILKSQFDLNLFDFISISSLSKAVQMKEGCFDGCVQVKGQLRQYLQQFVIGGRCMMAYNKKSKLTQRKIGDNDAVSLYASAQKRLYYPTGEIQTMTQQQIEYYQNKDNLFKIQLEKESEDQNTLYLEVKLKHGTKYINRAFPLISQVIDNNRKNINNFDESLSYFYDCYSLQELITHHQVEYEIISGVMLQTRNYNIQKCIENMFMKRVQLKEEKNQAQVIYKLMLTSSYGKTIEGIHQYEEVVLNKRDYIDYIYKNQAFIEEINQIGDKYIVKKRVEVIDQSAFTYIGVLILSISKRIMNEVMCTAEDNGIQIYYQDTDSMHMEQDDIPKLQEIFKQKYGRDLIGKKLGNFHGDFDSDKGEVLYADQSIFLGKKFYIDKLVVETKDIDIIQGFTFDLEDNIQKVENYQEKRRVFDYHIRGKGLTKDSIIVKAQELGISVIKLYEIMYEGVELEFDLCANHGVKFDRNKQYEYKTKESFIRKVGF
ncbi:DNA_polymerase [Hexamita inflata]|uniref:DNA-directed DNA polymerase n=1 Tax=Hexamita inflata TaxID=28002 RepID=A0AA86Q649_9EUKA|nr:DNA polymerase [Hexamita inflata]